MRTPRGRLLTPLLVLIGASLALAAPLLVLAQQPQGQPQQHAAPDDAGNPLPGTSIPCAPIAEKRQELGCYVVSRQQLGALREGAPPLFWHLDVFPDRAAAQKAKGRFATVVEAFDRTWLFTIAQRDWRPDATAKHMATVGPLPLEVEGVEYAAMYLATTFSPGHASFVHTHPGPEAWFIVSGEQCLETPDGAIPGRAGDGFVVRANLPMVIHATGSEIRRVFGLVLHDVTKPATSPAANWKPRGLCRG